MWFNGAPSVVNTVRAFFLLVAFWHRGVICDQEASATLNEVGITSSASGSNANIVGSKQHSSFTTSNVNPSVATVPVQGDEQYRATYMYQVPHHVNWNRDTYADAATEFGYNSQQPSQQPAATVSGPVYSPAYGSTDSEGYEDSYGGGGALGGLGGLGGIAGILGLKGIKGLGLIGLAKAAVPILGLLLPALLLIPLIFLFLPVPVITVPATGSRNLISGFGFGDLSGKVTNLARSVLESDKCVERISCEVSRVSRGSFLDKTLKRVLPRFEAHMPQALRRIARVYMEGQPGVSSCSKKYTCYLMDDTSSSGVNATSKKVSTS